MMNVYLQKRTLLGQAWAWVLDHNPAGLYLQKFLLVQLPEMIRPAYANHREP